MKNNTKEINLNEMEKGSGGRHYNVPGEITLEELLARKIDNLDGLDLSELKKRIPQENPDMIDPELLRKLAEQLREIQNQQ